jgi:4a-hydroxytetrahydrobiopterin dehydratase
MTSSCIPCSSLDSSFLLSEEYVREALRTTLPLWTTASNEEGSTSISRHFATRNFQCALDCINKIGAIAERESHHPDIHLTNYREVRISLWTHKLGGITESDLTLARMLDAEVTIEYSQKWLTSNPEADAKSATT